MTENTTQNPSIKISRYSLVEQYVAAVREQHEKEQSLAEVLRALAQDNQVFSLQCDAMRKLLTAFALESFGEVAVDWLEWWMWECDFGAKPAKMWMDGTEFDVSKLEDLYKFCLSEQKTEKS